MKEIITINNEHEDKHVKNLRNKYSEILEKSKWTESRLKTEGFHIGFTSLKDNMNEIPRDVTHYGVKHPDGPIEPFKETISIWVVFEDGHLESVPPQTIIDDGGPQHGQSILDTVKTQERMDQVKYAFRVLERNWGSNIVKELIVLVRRDPMPEITRKIVINKIPRK